MLTGSFYGSMIASAKPRHHLIGLILALVLFLCQGGIDIVRGHLWTLSRYRT